MNHCDGCDQMRPDVQSVGRDYNGDPDAPDLCFLCRKEVERGRVWDRSAGGYVHRSQLEQIDDTEGSEP